MCVCRFHGIHISLTNLSCHFQTLIPKSPSQCTKHPSNLPSYHCCHHCWFCQCILCGCCRCIPITCASIIIGSPTTPLHCCVPTLPVYLGKFHCIHLPIIRHGFNYYCQDDVNTTNALIVSIQMVMVGFVLHMVGGLYVAMLCAQILLKQEDGASNMATRSQLALISGRDLQKPFGELKTINSTFLTRCSNQC